MKRGARRGRMRQRDNHRWVDKRSTLAPRGSRRQGRRIRFEGGGRSSRSQSRASASTHGQRRSKGLVDCVGGKTELKKGHHQLVLRDAPGRCHEAEGHQTVARRSDHP